MIVRLLVSNPKLANVPDHMAIPKRNNEGGFLGVIKKKMMTALERKRPTLREVLVKDPFKVMKWTIVLFCSSVGTYVIFGGPLRFYKQQRVLQDARELELLMPDRPVRMTTEQKYSRDYGLNYLPKESDQVKPIPGEENK